MSCGYTAGMVSCPLVASCCHCHSTQRIYIQANPQWSDQPVPERPRDRLKKQRADAVACAHLIYKIEPVTECLLPVPTCHSGSQLVERI